MVPASFWLFDWDNIIFEYGLGFVGLVSVLLFSCFAFLVNYAALRSVCRFMMFCTLVAVILVMRFWICCTKIEMHLHVLKGFLDLSI